MQSFFWHDYETWGVNPAADWPSQFAGLRTDLDLNPIEEPVNILCAPPADCLPSLGAGLVTGLSPLQVRAEGMPEPAFFAEIFAHLGRAGTCGVGYNSIRFDDEVTRYGLYRNFYDPYVREWQAGCSRWDIVDLVRLCYAVRPDGIDWPMRELEDDSAGPGSRGMTVPSLKLELICQLNGIEHIHAHDALSDVYATIALAKKIKQLQPEMFNHVLGLRAKQAVVDALALGSDRMRLHISSRFGAVNASASMILPLGADPMNKNEIHCVDLRYSPTPLLELDAEELAALRFVARDQLPAGIERIPLKSVHLNRSPVVLTPKLVDDSVARRCNIDLEQCEAHRRQLLEAPGLYEKICQMAALSRANPPRRDVDAALYDGFITNADRQLCQQVVAMSGQQLAEASFGFADQRLPELLFRYRGRNFSESLTAAEMQQWREHIEQKLASSSESIDAELEAIDAAIDDPASDAKTRELALEFRTYYREMLTEYGA